MNVVSQRQSRRICVRRITQQVFFLSLFISIYLYLFLFIFIYIYLSLFFFIYLYLSLFIFILLDVNILEWVAKRKAQLRKDHESNWKQYLDVCDISGKVVATIDPFSMHSVRDPKARSLSPLRNGPLFPFFPHPMREITMISSMLLLS